jgi:hypothetical protein
VRRKIRFSTRELDFVICRQGTPLIDSGAVEMIPGDQVRAEMISALSPHARARRRA